MTKFENVGVFIRETVWLEPNLFRYKYSSILKPTHSSYLPAYENGTECSETSAYKIQTPGNCPEKIIQHSEHGESLKSKIRVLITNTIFQVFTAAFLQMTVVYTTRSKQILRRFVRMHVSIYWLTTGSSGCWSKAEEECVSILGEGLSEFGQSHFFHSHQLSHPVESIVVLEIETARPSETLRHLTNVNFPPSFDLRFCIPFTMFCFYLKRIWEALLSKCTL
jgi:hypothetical protein